jgi:hypothetical protein
MSTALLAVPAERLSEVAAGAMPLIKAMCEGSNGKYAPADVLRALAARDFQLWLARGRGGNEAAAVTEIVDYPQKRVCRLIGAVGRDMSNWIGHLAALETWAKAQGCSAMEPVARPGWERVLKGRGYRKTHVHLEKEL